MERLVAFNSKKQPFVYFIGLIPLLVIIIISGINASEIMHWVIFSILILLFLLILGSFIYHMLLPNIAFKIVNDQLVVYKIKKINYYSLKDIISVRVCDNSSSFDGYIKLNDRKLELHYFIKNRKEVLCKLEDVIKEYGIIISYYSVNIGD